jgi:predicted transcriptional regulator
LGVNGMADLLVRIETLDEWREWVIQALKAAQEGSLHPSYSIGFPTYAAMQDTLSPSRLEIVNALVGRGSLAVHEVARLVGRDVEAVRLDVSRLINSGVIERTADGVRFDYDGLRLPLPSDGGRHS